MFSFLNKEHEFGMRFSKEVQEHYIKKLKSGHFMSHGAVMNGYVLMPESMWNNLDELAQYLNESYDFVMLLKTK